MTSPALMPRARTTPQPREGLMRGMRLLVAAVVLAIGVGASSGERSVFLYLSFEHSFRP